MVNLKKITTSGKALYLAYDQGLEHGPSKDFNDKNVDPLYILKIAKQGKYNGIIFHKGIASKYAKEIKKSKVPLILKLNGKTKISNGDPISAHICSVDEAIKLGASAVGFTIYIGSKFEEEMMEEFSKIEKEAHAKNLPVIAWIYPRGKSVKNPLSREMQAYAARVALEIGADIAKIHYNGNIEDLKWAVKSSGRCKVVIAGGVKTKEKELLSDIKEIMSAGAIGVAIGRNVWQAKQPLVLTRKIKKIVFK